MLASYVGQRDALAPLLAALAACRVTKRPLPHSLLLGPPGAGKSTLARAIADELGVPLALVHAPTVRDGEQLAQAVLQAQGGVLFLDEIHSLDRKHAESLFTVIDESTLTVMQPVIGQGWDTVWVEDESKIPPAGLDRAFTEPGMYRTLVPVLTREREPVQMLLGDLTIIGATTDEALLPAAFLSRLSRLVVRLRAYTEDELATIGHNYARELGTSMSSEAASLLAARSRQTPRRMKHLTERAADFATVRRFESGGDAGIGTEDAQRACEALGVDENGLEPPHRAVLRALASAERGLSRTSLAQRLGIPSRNVELYWAELAANGLVAIDSRHRITDAGRAVLA